MKAFFDHHKIAVDKAVEDLGRRVMEKWSYLPNDDENSRLKNPDVVLSVPEIISRHGYSCETHTVQSQGYLLNVHRIPRARAGGDISSKTVLFQHGLFGSSADWILNGPDKALAYVLADAGYDVWLSNVRGNKYSREHVSLKTNSKAYWNFSWHEVALHDIPEIIDHILKLKGSDAKIAYVGHSMGTTILFAMLTLRPEYNKKLSAGFALAPVAFMSDIKCPLVKSLAPFTSKVARMDMMRGSYEFIPKKSALGRISSFCNVEHSFFSMDFNVRKNFIFSVCGYDEKQFNKELLPVFLKHFGTGTSWKSAIHFAQEILCGGRFQQYDYGHKNQEIYGTDTPPKYDLNKITLPIWLFWAQNDLLSSEKDVRMLYHRLPATTEMYMVPFPEFNHLDYLWAIDAPSLVNEKLLESLTTVFETKPKDTSFFVKK